MNSRFVSSSLKNENEERFEQSLRPKTFDEVIGREAEKQSLSIMIESAKKRGKALDHIMFHGPPGLGKTTLSYVVASEMNVPIHITSGSAIEKTGDLAAILTSLEPNSILFIDEIHRLKRTIEEILYPAMEDNVLDIVIGKGPSAKTLRLELNQFTIIGATTKLSMISAPLRDRFGMHFRLDFYSDDELTLLVQQKARLLGIEIDDEASLKIAQRSRMTARIAIRILKRVFDLAVVKGEKIINPYLVEETLSMMGVDENGLDELDRAILRSILKNFNNRPVGLNTLAASLSEEPETIELVYEPFLIKKGLIQRTMRGRIATDLAQKLYGDKL
ncbi:MAG: Holliday junction ATP-dependent DNA helicase RuvB [Candidatus Dojkabacteria bacterium]|nr:MAG: Holliday junction ATP-dependent DNA helicase RuvB [Candidatus Dojkabacteria bacterium]